MFRTALLHHDASEVKPEIAVGLSGEELRAIYDSKYVRGARVGWGPKMRLAFGYFTPDDHYEALVSKLVTPVATGPTSAVAAIFCRPTRRLQRGSLRGPPSFWVSIPTATFATTSC